MMTPNTGDSGLLRSLTIATLIIFCISILGNDGSLVQVRQSMSTYTALLAVGMILVASVSHSWHPGDCHTEVLAQILLPSVYRVSFHPLAKYPGPWIGAITDWYTVYHCMIGDRHIDFYKLHCRYGKSHLPQDRSTSPPAC